MTLGKYQIRAVFRCVWPCSWLPGRHLVACLCVDSTNLFSNPRRCVCPPTTERRDHCVARVAVFRLSCGNPVFLLWGWRAYLAVSRFYRYRVEDLLRFSNRNGGWSAVPVLTTAYEDRGTSVVGLGASVERQCGSELWSSSASFVYFSASTPSLVPCSNFMFDMQPYNCTRRSLCEKLFSFNHAAFS